MSYMHVSYNDMCASALIENATVIAKRIKEPKALNSYDPHISPSVWMKSSTQNGVSHHTPEIGF
jgi:hypothetical protein